MTIPEKGYVPFSFLQSWGFSTKVDLKQNLSYNQLVEYSRFIKLFSFPPQLLPTDAMRSIAKH